VGGLPPVLNPDLPADKWNCFQRDVVVSLRIRAVSAESLTAPDRDFGATTPPPSVFLQKAGSLVPGAVLALVQGTPISGANIGGTTCSENATFSDASSTQFSTASPPYAGVFKPAGAAGLATFDKVDAERRWSLELLNAGGPVVIECWTVEFSLVASPSGP
jgi:hypothetical protein